MSTSTTPERKMIDIHMHLIPGVDDGAEDMEMALAMMIRAKQQGILQIIATPHSEVFRYSKEGGKIIFKRLVDATTKVCPDVKLYLGCEARIMNQVLEDLNTISYYERKLLCANGVLHACRTRGGNFLRGNNRKCRL